MRNIVAFPVSLQLYVFESWVLTNLRFENGVNLDGGQTVCRC